MQVPLTDPSPPLQVAIIDDELASRRLIRGILSEIDRPFELVGEADSVATGQELIQQIQPDLIFLDIRLTDGTGFDLLERFPDPSFRVIFVTAFDDYAVRAFAYHALDYLLKPINQPMVERALERAIQPPLQQHRMQLKHLLDADRQQQFDKIILSTGDGLEVIHLKEIMYLTSDGGYTIYHLEGGERIILSRALGESVRQLPDTDFFRVHHSYVVHLRHVRKVLKEDGGIVVMSNGSRLPVSRRRKEDFLHVLQSYL